MMKEDSKKTLLHGWHISNHANMADFGGYEMPLWYSSAKDEHLAVMTGAGIFDTSHMASILVEGPDARDLLQLCFTNDMSMCVGKSGGPLSPGRCVYGAYLNEDGCVIDDSIIYMIGKDHYLAVVNAGMGGLVSAHFEAQKAGRDVCITDLTDNLCKLDIQGPLCAKIMKKILADPKAVFDKMPYFSFKGYFKEEAPLSDGVRLKDGTPVLLSRTGYTGEFGFEIFIAPKHFIKAWEMMLAAGEEFGLIPCGLAARDSLRAGAVLPLSHQDNGNWPFINHPWHFALSFNGDHTGFTKHFIGDHALMNVSNPEYTYPFAGRDLRKIVVCEQAGVFDDLDNNIGVVLTCVTDMAIGYREDRILSVASPDGCIPD